MEQGIKFGDFKGSISNNTFTLSLALEINNTGYYDMSDLNLTTILKDSNGTMISDASTFVAQITRGTAVKKWHNLSLSLMDIVSNMTYLLFEDTNFEMDTSVGMRYAYAFAFHLTIKNLTMPWGAPINNFSIDGISSPRFNGTHYLLDVPFSFENHSFFDIIGTLYMRIYNSQGGYIGSGNKLINVHSHSGYGDPLEVIIENPGNCTGAGYIIEASFENPLFGSINLGRITYG